jgi:hypothetical protein
MIITNIIYRDADGEFDYALEGYEVEIIDLFEDGIKYVNTVGEVVIENCRFEGNNAIIEK